jgi:hypothetical protein
MYTGNRIEGSNPSLTAFAHRNRLRRNRWKKNLLISRFFILISPATTPKQGYQKEYEQRTPDDPHPGLCIPVAATLINIYIHISAFFLCNGCQGKTKGKNEQE